MDEQFIRQQGAFKVTADSPIFASTKEFINWKPDTADDDSYILRAVTLLQDVLKFHETDDENSAFLDADLARLRFGKSVATGSESGVRYRAALRRFADQYADEPISTVALAALAISIHYDESDFAKANKVASEGRARFPDSIGAKRCSNLINQIESTSVQVVSERVWNGDDNRVDVRYQNIDKIWLRLVKFDYRNWKQWGRHRTPQSLYNEEFKTLLKLPTVKQWSVDLPPTEDFKQRTESILIDKETKDLPSGCYVLFSGITEEFNEDRSEDSKSISVSEIWISDLAVNLRRGTGRNQFEIQVLDANSGTPIAGAVVDKKAWKYDGRNLSLIHI